MCKEKKLISTFVQTTTSNHTMNRYEYKNVNNNYNFNTFNNSNNKSFINNAKTKESPIYYHTYSPDKYLPLLPKESKFNGFNPKNSPNMSHKEKVNKWIKEVPIKLINKDLEIWENNCYPAVIPISSCSSNSNYELTDYDDLLEFQSRKITKYVKKLYDLNLNELNDDYNYQKDLEFFESSKFQSILNEIDLKNRI